MNGPRLRDSRKRLSDLIGGGDLRGPAVIVGLLTIAVWALAILGAMTLISALFGTP